MAAQSLPKTLIISSTLSPNINRASFTTAKSMATTERTTTTTSTTTLARPLRRTMSAFEARISLVFALASQASSVSQRLLMDLASETAKYVFPKRFESRNLEEALMAVPDLETVRFKVLSRTDQYEIREVEPYFIAETTMPGKTGFDFNGASQSFNVLAEYLFGKNISKERMEMTTPVFTSRTQSDGERMEMTTPVISKKDSIKANNLDELFFTDKEVSMETLREKLSSAFPWLFWEDLESKLFAEDRMVEISDFQSLQEAIEKTTGSGSNVPDYMKIFAIGIEKARGKTTGFVHGNIALLVCAAVQEMEHMPLEDLDERMLSMWGAMLKSAREIGFQVDFAEILLKRNLFAYYVRPKLDDKNKVLENRG